VWRTLKRLRSARRKSAPWLVSLLALGTTILLVLVVPVFENFFEARPPDEPAMAAPLTSHPGREGAPALSSDGKMVAYPWTQPDMEDSEIYVREFPAGLDRKLTADGRNSNPVWSHDGRWIAYRHGLSSYLFQLRLMRSDGSDNHVLARLGPFSLPPTTGLAWSPDGAWLVASDVQTPGESEALFRIDRRSGAKTRLTTPLANSVGDSSPAISWSGKFLAFARLEHYGLGDIWVVPIGRNGLPTAAARQVTHQNTRAATPAWMPRDREIVFHSGFDYSQLVRIRADGGGQPITLRFGDGCEHPSIDRSGDIVFTRQHIQMNINLVALNAKGFPVGKSRLIAPSTRMDQFPRFLPDGKGIVFQSNRNGSSEIWTAKPDGSDALTLTSLRANSERPRPSPDGSTIVFESNATGIVKLYTVPISGGKPTRITYGAGADKGAAWSEDGRWIYFSSDREGRAAIYRAAAGGGPVQRVADGAAANLTDPVVSAGYLYFNRRENGQNLVWRESRVTGRGKLLTNDAYYADYWPSIRGLYYSSDSSGRRTLLLQRPGAFEASVVLSSDKPMDGPVVSKDGSRLLFFQLEEWTKNLFFSKLRN
ncbi:MAG TPA: hypothetical protein VHZ55_33645, partial [Bryobacteraceae bacterium]|nr:hypothetical protein [Bryobacteraceae bacterium]